MVTTQITDTGSGIDPKHVPHVFERFYKGAESNNPNRTGLGLSIVKEIIEQHKGTLAIDSIPGKGTTIKFHVPFV
jgi:signal transduction histidine kinase